MSETKTLPTPLDEVIWHALNPISMQRVVGAGISCFSEYGFHGTSTRQLATRADLSLGGIYIHFASKMDLLEFIIRSAHQELLADMTRADTIVRPPDRLFALVSAHVRFHAHRKTAARVANLELHSLPSERRVDIMEMRSRIEGFLTKAIEEGVESGKFHVDEIRPVVFGVLSMGLGITRWYHPEGRLSSDQIANAYGRAVLSMVQGQASKQSLKRK
jgi:AcrR family transcriptional regulator